MKKDFDKEFMAIQKGIVSLCLEATNGEVDKVFAYASIEDKSRMFNVFFEKDGEILTLNKVVTYINMCIKLLTIGNDDLLKIKKLCEENETKTPTEIKMYYDVKTGKFDATYKYEEICSGKTGIGAEDVFMDWYRTEKEKTDKSNQG